MRLLALVPYAAAVAAVVGAAWWGYRCGYEDGQAELLHDLDDHLEHQGDEHAQVPA
jgi:hypothetical protein